MKTKLDNALIDYWVARVQRGERMPYPVIMEYKDPAQHGGKACEVLCGLELVDAAEALSVENVTAYTVREEDVTPDLRAALAKIDGLARFGGNG